MIDNKNNYYNEIKNKLIDNEVYGRIKDYSKERHLVITYYEVGRILSEAGSHYVDDIIGEYSKKLMIEVGKKYNRMTLFRMKQFYNIFSKEKVSPVATLLTWSHYQELLPIKDINKLMYYINITIKNNLSKRELRDIIKNKEYERLPEETKNKIINREESTAIDYVKDPIIIKNNKYEVVSEKVLQKLIMKDIPGFLKELGTGFTFEFA